MSENKELLPCPFGASCKEIVETSEAVAAEREAILKIDGNTMADAWLLSQTSFGYDATTQEFIFAPTTIAERNGIAQGVKMLQAIIHARGQKDG